MYSMMYSMYVCICIVCGREYTTDEASLKQKPCIHFISRWESSNSMCSILHSVYVCTVGDVWYQGVKTSSHSVCTVYVCKNKKHNRNLCRCLFSKWVCTPAAYGDRLFFSSSCIHHGSLRRRRLLLLPFPRSFIRL